MRICLIVLSIFFCISAYAQEPPINLRIPKPIAIPADRHFTASEIRKAIIIGVLRRDWTILSESPGTVRIKLDHTIDRAILTLDVIYDDTGYSYKYVESDYFSNISRGQSEGWINNLNHAIDVELTIMKL